MSALIQNGKNKKHSPYLSLRLCHLWR